MKSIIIGSIGGVAILTILLIGVPEYGRYQARANANNQTVLNEIAIAQQNQLIQVETKKADIRVADAKGIAESQKIIDASLTANYLQYLAIQAQQAMAQGSNHTEVYIPVGTNGIPLVKTVNPSGN